MTPLIPLPSYGERATRAIAYLFRPYNDMDVYVEDESCLNMYSVFINRILNGKGKVDKIFQLGGRDKVIEACRSDQNDSRRKRLYLIDGDFDSILGKSVAPHLKFFYQLELYCSENLLFCENAISEVASECLTNKPLQELKGIVNFDRFIDDIMGNLKTLIIVYGAVHLLRPEDPILKTTGYNVTQLTVQRGKYPRLSRPKITQRMHTIISTISPYHSNNEIRSAIKQIRVTLPSNKYDFVKFISGKTYLLPLLNFHLRETVKLTGTLDQLKVRLARHCKLDIDNGIGAAIQNISRGI